MASQQVILSEGQNTIRASVKNGSWVKILDSGQNEKASATLPNTGDTYVIEAPELSAGTYTVECNGEIVSAIGDSVSIIKVGDIQTAEGVKASNSTKYHTKRELYTMGKKYTAVLGVLNIFDEEIIADMVGADGTVMMGGGKYWVNDKVTEGDYIEYSVVDKNDVLGLFAQLGLTLGLDVLELAKFVQKEYIGNNQSEMMPFDQAKQLVQGLFLRSIYNSVGTTGDAPVIRVRFEMAK